MAEWFQKMPGSDIGQSEEDPTMLLIGLGKPDWVKVPEELGGGQYRCLEVRARRCPAPGHEHQCAEYVLDGPVWCAECSESGVFLWYKRPQ